MPLSLSHFYLVPAIAALGTAIGIYLDNLSNKPYSSIMKTFSVGTLKSHFRQVLEEVKRGEEITIAYGKKHENIAVIIPYGHYRIPKRKIGILKNKGSFKLSKDFKMSDEELLAHENSD